MAQQNLLLERLAEQSQRLTDGVEALTQTLGEAGGGPSRARVPRPPAPRRSRGRTVCRPARASQGSRTGPEAFSGMILEGGGGNLGSGAPCGPSDGAGEDSRRVVSMPPSILPSPVGPAAPGSAGTRSAQDDKPGQSPPSHQARTWAQCPQTTAWCIEPGRVPQPGTQKMPRRVPRSDSWEPSALQVYRLGQGAGHLRLLGLPQGTHA